MRCPCVLFFFFVLPVGSSASHSTPSCASNMLSLCVWQGPSRRIRAQARRTKDLSPTGGSTALDRMAGPGPDGRQAALGEPTTTQGCRPAVASSTFLSLTAAHRWPCVLAFAPPFSFSPFSPFSYPRHPNPYCSVPTTAVRTLLTLLAGARQRHRRGRLPGASSLRHDHGPLDGRGPEPARGAALGADQEVLNNTRYHVRHDTSR